MSVIEAGWSGTKAQAAPRILHLSGDFPDPIEPFKTPVIRQLVDLTGTAFDHSVVSINRRSPGWPQLARDILRGFGRPALTIAEQPFDHGKALEYRAPPKGLYHAAMLHQLADWLLDRMPAADRPALLVGHKLTIEGIVVRRMAERLGVPYALSIQGDTDTRIIAARPDLRRELAATFHGAAMVFPFAPWSLLKVEAALGTRSGPCRMLPCPTDLDSPLPPARGDGSLISVFHLKNYRRKNLRGMIAGAQVVQDFHPAFRLGIIGGGDPEQVAECAKLAAGVDRISFEGPMDRLALRARMNRATGFVMPSLRESFGLVFVEALFAGLPIIYPAGTSVEGYFDDVPFAIRVDPEDPAAIGAAMRHVLENERELKADLARWQSSDDALRFTQGTIARHFAEGLQHAAAAG